MRISAALYSWLALTVIGCATISLAHADSAPQPFRSQTLPPHQQESVIATHRTHPACVGLNPAEGSYWNCMFAQSIGITVDVHVRVANEQIRQQQQQQQQRLIPLPQQQQGQHQIIPQEEQQRIQQQQERLQARGIPGVRERAASSGQPLDPRATLEVLVMGSPQHTACVQTTSSQFFRASGVDPGWADLYAQRFCEIPVVFMPCVSSAMERLRYSREANGYYYFSMGMGARMCGTGMRLVEDRAEWSYEWARR